jgi:CubicO group peptidase (beta-lactamase class C family)
MQRREFLTGIVSSPMIAPSWKQGPPHLMEIEILNMMRVAPVPGAVMGTLRNGSIAWIHPLGARNLEAKDPVTRETVFQAASLSKQATAYAAFALRDAGKLDFDRTLVS